MPTSALRTAGEPRGCSLTRCSPVRTTQRPTHRVQEAIVPRHDHAISDGETTARPGTVGDARLLYVRLVYRMPLSGLLHKSAQETTVSGGALSELYRYTPFSLGFAPQTLARTASSGTLGSIYDLVGAPTSRQRPRGFNNGSCQRSSSFIAAHQRHPLPTKAQQRALAFVRFSDAPSLRHRRRRSLLVVHQP
jgi:hypothetical protein